MMTKDVSFKCKVQYSFHAICEMHNDIINEIDVIDVFVNGERVDVDNETYFTDEGITVVTNVKPCHYYVITLWKGNESNNSYKDKVYRRRRYMKRKKGPTECPRCRKGNMRDGEIQLMLSEKSFGHFKGSYCPNCGISFFDASSVNEIKQVINDLGQEPLTVDEIILAWLYGKKEPVMGAISFMKQLFLFYKEKLPEFKVLALDPHFISYHYGPYSFDIVHEWKKLREDDLIAIEGKKSSNKETFILTDEGKKVAKEIFDQLPSELKYFIPNYSRGLHELGNDGILLNVYRKYPQYTDKSKIKEKVLPRDMRGKA